MDDLGVNPIDNGETDSNPVVPNGLNQPDKIPFKFFDMHGDIGMLIFEPYMEEEHILPKTGFNIVSFNAHFDELVPEDMQLRLLVTPPSERHLFDDFGVESWIKLLAEKGYVKHVVWIKPPWTQGVPDGNKVIQISNPQSNLNSHEVTLDIKTLCRSVFEDVQEDYAGFKTIFSKFSSEDPYILDFELSFFSCDNSFTDDYEKCPKYYSLFKDLFKIKSPASMDPNDIKVAYDEREKNLKELEEICEYLQTNRTLPTVEGEHTLNYQKITEIKEELLKYYEDNEINWRNIYSAGLVCNEYQLPIHYTERDDIEKMVNDCVSKIVDLLPTPPTVITVAIMYEYLRFSPEKDLDFIIDLIKDLFKKKYANIDSPEFIGY